ncbi:carboxypeptidase regulatory-like domain-containing protein [Actinomadura logoneensis]|uniref:Carboxypeptidase regulatory-like domain-containing protein n=1 Tax=Actinomadura logoneensis TaxID=2293572 RepID=A0A372JUL7_9ACTN|nr:carboxypeptidase-like regulatory domain-containing protein [Actinomadura logoneensis]RFU43434.1 carboxypeptidase regulatory-like domain-containing protein [Actinomadura logoneensis]
MLRLTTVGVTSALLLGTLTAVPAFADGTPAITIAATPASVDPEHPSATITGKVTDADGAPVPAGTNVELTAPEGHGTVTGGATDADGNYTASVSPDGTSDSVVVIANVPTLSVESQPLTIQIDRGPTDTAVTASRTTLDEGQTLTLNGTVTYKGNPFVGGGKAVIGQTADAGCSAPPMTPQMLTIGADGKFGTTVKPSCPGTFYVDSSPAGLYKGGRSTLAHTTVRYAGQLAFSATMDPYGQVTAWTTMKSPSGGGTSNRRKVVLEYSSNGTTGWKTVKTFSTYNAGYKATTNVYYSGYWRSRFAGDAKYAPVVSPTKKLWRWSTKMSKLAASKTSIKKNKYITVSGYLYRWNTSKNGYGAFGGQSVRIIFRFKGKKTWYHVKWVKTDRKGHYSAKVRAYGDGYFAAVFGGTSDTWAAGTPNDRYVNTYAVPAPGQRSGPAPVIDVRPWRG